MTPELRTRFELTIKAGEEVVLPYTGIDYRLDLVDVVYFVNVRYEYSVNHTKCNVWCHAIVRGSFEQSDTYELTPDDPLYVMAMERAKA